jgi:S-adenosylmethionine decarboxylase
MQAKIWNHSQWITETNPSKLKKYFKKLLIMSGFNILKISQHNFKPYGYTALFLLSESHFAIHTFPEENKTYIELSSCVKKQFDMFINNIEIT